MLLGEERRQERVTIISEGRMKRGKEATQPAHTLRTRKGARQRPLSCLHTCAGQQVPRLPGVLCPGREPTLIPADPGAWRWPLELSSATLTSGPHLAAVDAWPAFTGSPAKASDPKRIESPAFCLFLQHSGQQTTARGQNIFVHKASKGRNNDANIS